MTKRMRVGRRMGLLCVVVCALVGVVAGGPARPAHAAQGCFPQTGFCVDEPFLSYWQTHGGLSIYGYPVSDLHNEVDPQTGNVYPVQWFERNRFEYHAENAGTPYAVLLGLLGNQVTAGRTGEPPFQPIAPFTDSATRRYFNATGHSLAYGFKEYWDTHGGLAQFGYPTSEEFTESTAQGSYTVQYFERARFEYHPEAPPAYRVLLGLLGDQLQGTLGTAPTITVTSGGASTTILEHGTALLPGLLGGGATTFATVSIHFPASIIGQSFAVQVLNPNTTMWQVAPNTLGDSHTYSFDLAGKNYSGAYLQLGVSHGTGNSLIWFGLQFHESVTWPTILYDNRTDPAQFMQGYYNAITRREYDRAYAGWAQNGTSATSTPPDFHDFVQGYAATSYVAVYTGTVQSNGTAGSIYYAVPVALVTPSPSGPGNLRFYGCYLLRQIDVPVGASTPPYPLQLETAHIFSDNTDTVATLLAKATAYTTTTECAP